LLQVEKDSIGELVCLVGTNANLCCQDINCTFQTASSYLHCIDNMQIQALVVVVLRILDSAPVCLLFKKFLLNFVVAASVVYLYLTLQCK
jgi:hypothetical protein